LDLINLFYAEVWAGRVSQGAPEKLGDIGEGGSADEAFLKPSPAQPRVQPDQREPRITLQKFPRWKCGSLSASTSAFTLPKVVSGLCLMPS
jgi:hypothetical protein